MPTAICHLQGLESYEGKGYSDRKKLVEKAYQAVLAVDLKITETSNAPYLQRMLCDTTPREVLWRSVRSYVVVDTLRFDDKVPGCIATDAVSAAAGVPVIVSGYLRGIPLALNSLVQIVGVGPCKVERIEQGVSPFDAGDHRAAAAASSASAARADVCDSASSLVTALTADSSQQESLVLEAAPDLLMGDQTWPQDDEMTLSESDLAAGRNRRNAPHNVKLNLFVVICTFPLLCSMLVRFEDICMRCTNL